MSVEKEFIPYEEALALKELGFDEPCFATWNGETLDMLLQITSDDYFTSAPTFSQAFRFLREKHNLHYFIDVSDGVWFFDRWSFDGYKTYEEAELACLRKLIEIVQGGNNDKVDL